MYDVIGDIHGHAGALRRLLAKLGYRQEGDAYRHPDRQALFVGDFIDRGPQIRETLRIVRAMIDTGAALGVMGNHEFNALAYHTPDPARPGEYLRRHSERNWRQHGRTVEQLGSELSAWLDWFRTLPIWLDLPGVRVVHACWDDAAQDVIAKSLAAHGGVTDSFLVAASERDTPLCEAIEDVLKGKEMPLPEGIEYIDKDGNRRRAARVRWFEAPTGRMLPEYTLPADPNLPAVEVLPHHAQRIRPYAADAPPLFVGHYWLRADTPTILAGNIACVDFSVAKEGLLCAYCWQGERQLTNEHWQCVSADGE